VIIWNRAAFPAADIEMIEDEAEAGRSGTIGQVGAL
jgi:hypothetical protein